LKSFIETRDAWIGIVGVRPEDGYHLANTWGWIAKAHEAQGGFDAAIDAQRTKIGVVRKLPDVDMNRRAQQLLANSGYELGRLQLALGQYGPAERTSLDALAQYEALVAVDSANTAWLAQMTFARLSLAEIELAMGERKAARTNLVRAEADMARLLSADSTRNRWNIALRGSLLLNSLPLSELQGPLDAFLATVKSAESSGKPLDTEQTRIVSAVELALGDLLARRGQLAPAQAHWRAANERLQALAADGELPALTLLAQARLRLGALDEARSLAKRIEVSPYRHPAYADLRQRLAAAGGAVPVHP
jgi:tetratricopeptide (TPR) repeat protein